MYAFTNIAKLERSFQYELINANASLGYIGEPKDIANAVIFLADNEKARFIVGQTLLVDGGQKDDLERTV